MKTPIPMLLLAVCSFGLSCCSDAILIEESQEVVDTLRERSSCNIISQDYLSEIRSISAITLGVPQSAVRIGAVEATNGIGTWHRPESLLGKYMAETSNCLFVSYLINPTVDDSVVGYYSDEDFCIMPNESNKIVSNLDGILQSTLGIIIVDCEGF